MAHGPVDRVPTAFPRSSRSYPHTDRPPAATRSTTSQLSDVAWARVQIRPPVSRSFSSLIRFSRARRKPSRE
jgi:hypothetical protein